MSSSSQRLDSDARLSRYSRHILLPSIDIEGQERLLNSAALIVGLGGLGSIVSQYLAASGVGLLTLVDPDVVELSNLQRQIVHDTSTIGCAKVYSAKQRLRQLNSEVQVNAHQQLFSAELLAEVPGYDVVVDCTDNFATRLSINAACMQHQVPLIIGSAIQMSGQIMVVDAREQDQPCYACLHRDQPVSEHRCSEMGVLSPLLGVIGSLQAVEAIKYLLGLPMRTGELWLYDALSGLLPNGDKAKGSAPAIESIRFSRWAACPHHER